MKYVVEFLGQAGFRIGIGARAVYIDPYLSDSVRQLDAPDLVRQVPVPIKPEEVNDANWVLLTHAHIDHCDPDTLPALAQSSPQACFIGPWPVVERLKEWHIADSRIIPADERWVPFSPIGRVKAIPAAHPSVERDHAGRLACVGYLIEGPGAQRVYFAGDTSVDEEIIAVLQENGPVTTAFLPVNEQNFFRARRGIIGNMSIREAFLLAAEIGANRVFPYHWDMFAVNSAFPEEIGLLYNKMGVDFSLLESPCSLFEDVV
jgi:L-ascorbate 6-phosphate lactonase